MALKSLTPKKLKRMQAQLELFEFYGISEEDVRNLPNLIKQNVELKEHVDTLESEVSSLKNTIKNLTDPENKAKKDLSDIAKDCFTLPDDKDN